MLQTVLNQSPVYRDDFGYILEIEHGALALN